MGRDSTSSKRPCPRERPRRGSSSSRCSLRTKRAILSAIARSTRRATRNCGNSRRQRRRDPDRSRTMPTTRVALAGLGALFVSVTLHAHHSHGNYDLTKWTTMEGEVKELHLLVPHSWIYLDVKDEKGEPITWALEATGPSGLTQVGIKREDVRPGDKIKVRCHLLRDGSNGCLLGYVTPMHGDVARGHGVEKDWDGNGGAGFSTAPVATPR